jgi:hypothetical protein
MRLLATTSALAVCCLATFISMPPATAQTADSTATVNIHVIDERGLTIEDCKVQSFQERYRDDLASHFRGLQGTRIPPGVYSYELARPFGTKDDGIKGAVAVFIPEVLIVVPVRRAFVPGVSVDKGLPVGFFARGRIEPMPARLPDAEPLWVRLSPVHWTQRLDVSVDASGEFRIYEPLTGRYLLTVIRGRDILYVQQILFDADLQRQDFVVRLPKEPPSIVRVQKN